MIYKKKHGKKSKDYAAPSNDEDDDDDDDDKLYIDCDLENVNPRGKEKSIQKGMSPERRKYLRDIEEIQTEVNDQMARDHVVSVSARGVQTWSDEHIRAWLYVWRDETVAERRLGGYKRWIIFCEKLDVLYGVRRSKDEVKYMVGCSRRLKKTLKTWRKFL